MIRERSYLDSRDSRFIRESVREHVYAHGCTFVTIALMTIFVAAVSAPCVIALFDLAAIIELPNIDRNQLMNNGDDDDRRRPRWT